MSKTTFYQKNYIGHPPVKLSEYENPGSYHWMNQALNYECWLKLKMGEEQYYEWAGRLFQEGNEPTWKEISELYEAKFRVIQREEREAERHDQDNDPKHYKMNGGG